MSRDYSRGDPEELQKGLDEYGAVSEKDEDPLAEIEEKVRSRERDPFHVFFQTPRFQKIQDNTFDHWVRSVEQWSDFMEAQGRHPACPAEVHVVGFVQYLREHRGNTDGVIKSKLRHLNAAYKWWQGKRHFDHPVDFNPFGTYLEEGDLESGNVERNYPRVALTKLRDQVNSIKNIRERAITVVQLKLGARSGELANIELADINIEHPEAREHYDQIGTHHQNEKYPNTVFIPADRLGNKREVDTILPLDEETRQAIVDWLLIRPDNGKDVLFLTDKGKKLNRTDIGYLWEKYWRPEYEFDEDSPYDSISPHFSRHYFTTWWSNQGIPRDKAMYMRGDRTNEFNEKRSAIDNYIHEYYEDIEDIYREQIFQLMLDSI